MFGTESEAHADRLTDRVTSIVAIGFIAGIALSWRLWCSSSRKYPRVPVLRGVHVAAPVELALAVLLVVALVCCALRIACDIALPATLVLTAMLVALDQSRLQPWVFEYCLLLAVVAFRNDDRNGVAGSCRFIVIALYFWSAVQKMNVTFVTITWREFLSGLNAPGIALLERAGWLIPFLELSIALGLAIPRLRRASVVAAIAMHAAIVALLVATGENSVVWPWNVALAMIVFVLFRDSPRDERNIIRGDRTLRHGVAVLVAGILPALSFVGLWDAYLSGALYSGNTLQAVVLVAPETAGHLPPIVEENTWRQSRPNFIDINRLSYAALNVPAYPADRVLRAVGGELCRTALPFGDATVRILERPSRPTEHRAAVSYSCSSLTPVADHPTELLRPRTPTNQPEAGSAFQSRR